MQTMKKARCLVFLCLIIIFYGCSDRSVEIHSTETRTYPQKRLVKTQYFQVEVPLEWHVHAKHHNTLYVRNPRSGEVIIFSVWAVSPNVSQEEIVRWLRSEAAELAGNGGEPIQRKIGERVVVGVRYPLPPKFLHRSKGLHKNMDQFIYIIGSSKVVLDMTILYDQTPTKELEHVLHAVHFAR